MFDRTKKLFNMALKIFPKNKQKVLNIILYSINWLGRLEMEKKAKISKSSLNAVLRELAREDLIIREAKGKQYFYKANLNNPAVKQLKVIAVIFRLASLIKEIKPISRKIILFGSSSRGEDAEESDIDLFVMTRNKEEIMKKIKDSGLKNIQPIIKTPHEFSELKHQDSYFYHEIDRGVILYEEK